MIKTAALVALAALAAGCTTFDLGTRFTKADASVSQESLDEWECHRDMRDPQTVESVVGGPIDAVRIVVEAVDRERTLVHCMRGRGYEPTRTPGPVASVNSARAAR